MKKSLLFFFILSTICLSLPAQIKRTNNKDLVLARQEKPAATDEARITAEKFFELARNNKRDEWERLLSRSCYSDSSKYSLSDGWYRELSQKDRVYKLSHESYALRKDQKTFIYTCKQTDTIIHRDSLTLVKENGKWRIIQLSL